ncbi:hypothetical protein FQN57_003125 [Myotisia sp. PD_48]|nr:hypothetical protein FQN57_003125 [Myotisia sp. PD_48]
MAVNMPPSPLGKQTPRLQPVLSTRSGNEFFDRPQTPTHYEFISPVHTPYGSPSKSRPPPGATDLPNIFDNAMRLTPSSPSKSTFTPSNLSPGRAYQRDDDLASYNESVIHRDQPTTPTPGSPTRISNKENAPIAALRVNKDSTPTLSHAAISRQEPYQARERMEAGRRNQNQLRGLTAEELEKVQLPNVKRLANVTQLYFLDHYFDLLSYVRNRQNRSAQFKAAFPLPPATPVAEYEVARHKYLGRERANLRKRRTRMRYGDFQVLTQVGQGGYGQVYLAQKKDTREVCALKVMSKKLLFKLDEIRHILTERDILTTAKSEWLVKLLYAFQDDDQIYLAMEYVPGGDFRTLLNNTRVLHNRHARFYISEMVTCVDALHVLGYIHRDLKPENFLIDSSGHVKLTDFGLAAGMLNPRKIESMRLKLEEVGRMPVPFGRPMEHRTAAERREGYQSLRRREVNYAKSIVGSPDYMAPEVLSGDEYDFTVDYWSLGCMLFEALTGYPPFAGETVDETWQNLKHWKDVLQKPKYEDSNYFLSRRTWDLITRLVADRECRFNNIKEIQTHDYFAEVDFHALREMKPPFVPDLDSETDAGYFDDFGNEADMAKYKEVHEKQKALEDMADRDDKLNKGVFVGFTFRYKSRKHQPLPEKKRNNDKKDLNSTNNVPLRWSPHYLSYYTHPIVHLLSQLTLRQKTIDIITLFHKPSIPSSARALELLQKASTATQQASVENGTSPLRKSAFELEVTENPPTPDQLRLIMEYMDDSVLGRGGVGVGKPGELVNEAHDRSDALKKLKENGDKFIRPVVVDWNNGNAVLGTDESAILKLLKEEGNGGNGDSKW